MHFGSNPDEYNLITFGDIGNIDYFAKNSFANHGIPKPPPDVIDKWYSDFLKNQYYDTSNMGCKITLKDSNDIKPNITTDLEKEEGLVNFNQVIKNKDVNNLLKQTDGFVLLGDVAYVESKYLVRDNKDDRGVTLDHMDKWRQRIECGWNLFLKSLESIDIIKVTGGESNNLNNLRRTTDRNQTNSNMNFFLYDNAEILSGNHTFDVDYRVEEKYLRNFKAFSKKNKYLSLEKLTFGGSEKHNNLISYTPKFITITFNNFKIQFLDFNSHIMSCLNGDEVAYKICNQYNPSFIPYKEAIEYGKRLKKLFKKFEDDSSSYKVWRVMRAYHSPLYSENKDSSFYFEDLNLKNKTINIFNSMKNKRVNFFIGSNIHNAQVIAYPYSRKYKQPDLKCNEQPGDRWGCYKVEPNVFNKNPVFKNQCENNLIYNLPIRDRTDPSQLNDMLYIFITGNSGRLLKGVKEGKKTDGILLWNRSTLDASGKFNYGFSYSRFSRYQVEIDFYEVDDGGMNLNKAATFVVKEGKLPDEKLMEDFMNTKCLN